MDTKIDLKSRASRLAKQLEEDIRKRAFRVGDQYMTASEAAAMFGVSTSTADRAMKLLADSELLLRRQNQGTFIGPQAAVQNLSTTRTVYIMLPLELEDVPIRSDLIIKGIRDVFQGVNIQFGFYSRDEYILHVRELINSAKSGSHVAGLVPMSAPREVYQLLAASSVPGVVMGTPYIGDPPIASVDTDNRAAGRLLTEYLVERGHDRIAILSISEGRPGDYDFYDGVMEALTAASLPPTALLIRNVPDDFNSCSTIARHTLESADRPTAFIARHAYAAELITAAATGMGFKVPEDIEVVFEDLLATQSDRQQCVCTRPKVCTKDVFAQIGKMLKALSEGKTLQQQRMVIPVELRLPSSS